MDANFSFVCVASKGMGVNMLKVGTKRRRTTAQVKADKEEAKLKEANLQERLAKLQKQEKLAHKNQAAADVLGQMIDAGVAVQDPSGNIVVPSASKKKQP